MAHLLGTACDRPDNQLRKVGVIGRVERSHSGNVILRAGDLLKGHGGFPKGWTQTLHIVLDPGEVLDLMSRLQGQLDQTDPESGRD
jgi:hypothetical protein